MKIQTVSIIGLGALGILYGHYLSGRMKEGELRIIANAERISRYEKENIYCNGELCKFHYVMSDSKIAPCDLIIFAVKFNGLESAVKDASSQIGPNTTIISLLNGITSEEYLAKCFGEDKVLLCTAQGMDAVKEENKMSYKNMGTLRIGTKDGSYSKRLRQVDDFFTRMDVPHEVCEDMPARLWGKLLLNTGVNQAVTVYETNYGGVQKAGKARDMMIGAMKEVVQVAQAEGINLKESDLKAWLDLIDTLNPLGKPSMRQDAENHRFSEVDLFSGTIRKLGRKHHIKTPVNDYFYETIKAMEAKY